MANVLGELFGDIASAIREKTGDAEKMKPAQFPEKISEIETGTDTGEIDRILDQINGVVVGETLCHVTFVHGTELCKVDVYEGYDCQDPVSSGLIDAPTKESTKYAHYTFSGWSLTEGGDADDSALLAVEWNRTVYAAFRETPIYLATGNCGDSVRYNINPDYVVEISGTGKMTTFNDGDVPPWNAYRSVITEVVVTPGVTIVGAYAFENCPKLASVTLPEGLTTIEWNAFCNCPMLTAIALPSTTLYLYAAAFAKTSIRRITFPYDMRMFDTTAFDRREMESITLTKKDGWRRGNSLMSDTIYIQVTPYEAESSDRILEILRAGVETRYWWNSAWKEENG